MILNRRLFLECVSAIAIACISPVQAALHGSVPPTNASIAVSTLTPGTFLANAFTGFTSPASTVVTTGGFKYIAPTTNTDQFIVTSTYSARDIQFATWFSNGCVCLRKTGTPTKQSFLYFRYNQNITGGNVEVGIMLNHDSTQGYEVTGNQYPYYGTSNLAASAEGIAAGFTNSYSSGNLFTFGVQGFTVFLQWNGIDIIRYTEWRLMGAGTAALWVHTATDGARDITVTYPTPTALFSDIATQTYDPRDFGMRNVAARTGSMAASSNQITGVTAGAFQIGDQIIVEIGGEAGAGARGTKGVGGTWPTLSYATTTAMNADTSQAVGTFAYDRSEGTPISTYAWTGSVWQHGSGPIYQSYYQNAVIPLSLVAIVTNVSGTTLTLNKTSSVATTNANIYLDSSVYFLPISQANPPNGGSLAPELPNITMSIPSSQSTGGLVWYFSTPVNQLNSPSGPLTIKGAGRTLTTIKTPKGCIPGAFSYQPSQNGCVMSDMKYIGNAGDNGYGPAQGGANTFQGYVTAFYNISVGSANAGVIIRNIDSVDMLGQTFEATGKSPLIDNCTSTLTVIQQDYVGWQIQISNSNGGSINNCTVTGAKLIKAFEFFACNGTQIVGCDGTNAIFSTNSSSNWVIDCRGKTLNYTTDCYVNQLSGAIDEGLIQITSNAYHIGGGGVLYPGKHIQTGYARTSDSTSMIHVVASVDQPNLTISGSYPGGGGCSTSLDGLFQCPNYNASTPEYGSIIYCDAAAAIISGLRIKGTAIGSPGHSGHYGNISMLGATSQANNNVADVIQPGPTISGNQTNAAYGGC